LNAVYPGSFDPVTAGHYDIIKRAAAMYDNVTVLVAANVAKSALFGVDERVSMLKTACASLTNVDVDRLDSGLLVDYAKANDARVIIKGLRAVSDFEYEFQMALLNRRLRPEIETVFLMAGSEHSFLSSSIVKEIGRLGGRIEGLVPDVLLPAIQSKFAT
jgi:pantetheine-phosphate adenylyltransferase